MEYYTLSDEDLVFDINEETGTCTLEKGDVEGFIVKGGANVGYDVDRNQCFLLMKQPGFQKRIGSLEEPMAPKFINDKYRAFVDADIPFIRLEFAILPFDVKGNAIDQENLRYSFWRDDEKMFIDLEEFPNYENLPEATYELDLSSITAGV